MPSDIAFVSQAQIPPSKPPVVSSGAIGWVRENLFDGWLNSLLTVLSVVVLALILPPMLQWAVFDAVWNAGSVAECRQIDDGACWAVFKERLNQFLFGFYPPELYWRPILAFCLLFVALGPVLFSGFPMRDKAIWGSLAFPVIAYYLLWGGALWGIAVLALVIALIFVLAAFVAREHDLIVGVAVGVAAFIALMLDWSWLLVFVFRNLQIGGSVYSGAIQWLTETVGFVGFEPVESAKMGGFLLSITIGVVGICGSLPLGILLALGRRSKLFFIRTMCTLFIEFVRGVPLITLLFVASVLLNYFLPPGTSFDLILRVVIMVTLFASAYMAEVIRGGLAALPQGQFEAADSLGLNYSQSMRLIVLPQALKISIPSIVNTFIGLFKDTTLVSVIGLLDPLGMMKPITADAAWDGMIWELLIFIGAVFWICCFSMSRYSMYLERKLRTDHR